MLAVFLLAHFIVTAGRANASSALVSMLAKTTLTQWRGANVRFDPVGSGVSFSLSGGVSGVSGTCSRGRRPSLPHGLTLTLVAELMVLLAPELLRLAVRRPQIRDVAMFPSAAENQREAATSRNVGFRSVAFRRGRKLHNHF